VTGKTNVGYIGLGNIGKPSAKHLVCDAFNAHVYDVYQPAVDELVEAGAIGCSSVAELSAACGHIGICVRDDGQVEELLYGEGGILANAAPGTLVAIHSTVTQASLLKWSVDAREAGPTTQSKAHCATWWEARRRKWRRRRRSSIPRRRR
jgi:3-hydroxyisobutyrate dehydrogenase